MSETETAAPVEATETAPTEQPEPTEQPAAPEPEQSPEERAKRSAFAEARRWRRDQESRLAAERRAIEAEREALKTQHGRELELLGRLKKGEIVEALLELGVDADALVADLTAAATQTPEQRRMARELRELREERERERKQREEQERQHVTAQARARIHEQVSDAVASDTDPRIVRLRTKNPEGAKEFVAAVAARAEQLIARGERAVLSDIAEAVWRDARRTYDLARIAFDDDGTPTQAAPGKSSGKSPPKPSGGAVSAKEKLAKASNADAIKILTSLTDAEIEELARG